MQECQYIEALKGRFNARERIDFLFFWKHQSAGIEPTAACFSQWYPSPFEVDGVRYPTAEHFMMVQKAGLFGDMDTREQILRAPTSSAAKSLGRHVRGFREEDWIDHRFEIVVRGNEAKFAQHRGLGIFLRQTAPKVLVEASPFDQIWGIGLRDDNLMAIDPNHWRGLNLLGFALMEVRARLSTKAGYPVETGCA